MGNAFDRFDGIRSGLPGAGSPTRLCEESRPELVEGRDDEVAQSAMAPEALTIWTSGRGTVNPLSLYLPFPHKWWKGRMGNAFDRFDGIRSGLPGVGSPACLCEESRMSSRDDEVAQSAMAPEALTIHTMQTDRQAVYVQIVPRPTVGVSREDPKRRDFARKDGLADLRKVCHDER